VHEDPRTIQARQGRILRCIKSQSLWASLHIPLFLPPRDGVSKATYFLFLSVALHTFVGGLVIGELHCRQLVEKVVSVVARFAHPCWARNALFFSCVTYSLTDLTGHFTL
jgi:hypothetical protein